jgi:hypothetical protein
MNENLIRGRTVKALVRFAAASLLVGCAAVHAELVAVVGAGSPATKVSADQLQAIFLMRLKTLPGAGNAQLVMVGSTRAQLLTVLGKSEDQIKAIWVRQVFTGGGSQPVEVPDAAEAKKALKNPNAIAVIDASQVDASVKVIGQF